MIVLCKECGSRFDDAYRTTICPHATFPANDGNNNFAHHPDSFLEQRSHFSDIGRSNPIFDAPDVPTNGPWKIMPGKFGAVDVMDANFNVLASLSFRNSRGDLLPGIANGRVMAAGWGLYVALKGLLVICGYKNLNDEELEHESKEGNGSATFILAARRAIAKAEKPK